MGVGKWPRWVLAKALVNVVMARENYRSTFDGLRCASCRAARKRAKRKIWTSWDQFQAYTTFMKESALAVADAARDGGDVKAASRKMFKSCKSCHQDFRRDDD